MRVTTFGMDSQYMLDLNNVMTRIQGLEQQLSTGRKLNQPSDDPVGFSSDIQTQTMLTQVTQWQGNAQSALSSMQTADSSMGTLQNVLGQIRTQLVQANNGTNTPSDIQQIAAIVSQMASSVEQVANTSDGEKYVFAGVNGTVKPMNLGTSTWSGSSTQPTTTIGDGVTIAVGADGNALFNSVPTGAASTMMTALNNIVNDLNTVNRPNLQQDLAELDVHVDQVSAARADLGGRMNRVESSQTQLGQMIDTLKTQKGNVEDANIADVASQLAMQQTTYQAALDTGQRLILPTLADVLKL